LSQCWKNDNVIDWEPSLTPKEGYSSKTFPEMLKSIEDLYNKSCETVASAGN